MTQVLVVEDNESFAFGLRRILGQAGFECASVASGEEALAAFARASWDVVLLDLGLPDQPGLDVLGRLVEADPFCAVIVLTGRDDASTAVKALHLGATHYLIKPVNRDELLFAIARACERFGLRRRLEAAGRDPGGEQRALGESAAWRKAMSALYAAARVPRTSVLVTGESGTGKELAARLLHTWSDRAEGPFVPVNTACFSPSLLESELFGHEAGAFTGARAAKRGLFELASGGTLFLDEVGELPIELQPKLLRVLEGHPFRRVGGEREVRADVRLVSATNRELDVAIEAGQFRRDLYHRLRVVDIVLPPLRERGEDIALLAAHFISRLSAELGKHRVSLSLEALRALQAYPWPGNVRELRNVIERGIVLCQEGEIQLRDLPPEVSDHGHGAPIEAPASTPLDRDVPSSLDAVIREHVLRTFQDRHHNLTQTARVLGISRVALRRRLKEYGVKAASAAQDHHGGA